MSERDGRKKVLFVCIGNACRSPMAEAIARRDAPDAIDAFSAGLMPIGFLPELTEQTLMKNGYSVEGLESKGISPKIWGQADIVINMSGRPRELAFREYSKVEDWEMEDPFGEDLETHQRVFEKIRLRVGELAQQCRTKNSGAASAERRTHARLGATSLIFTTTNAANGGIVFNISEGGLALSAAMRLLDGPLCMRIQFPESRNWIAAIGRIAWKSKSNKEAGVRFVDLTEEARQHIRNWIASQAPSLDCSEQTESSPEQRHVRQEITSAPPLGKMIARSPTSGDTREEHLATWLFPPAPAAASTSPSAKLPVSGPRPYVGTNKRSDKNAPQSRPRPASEQRGLRAPQRRLLGTFVAVGLLAAFIALVLERMPMRVDGRNESITPAAHRAAESTGTLPSPPVSSVASEPSPIEDKLSAPVSEAKPLPDPLPTDHLPTDIEESVRDASAEKVPRQVSVARGAFPSTTLKPPRPPKKSAPPRLEPTEPPSGVVANVNSLPIDRTQPQKAATQPSSPQQLETPKPPPLNVASNAPAAAPDANLEVKKEPAAPAVQPVTAPQMTGEVSVLTDAYPSLRADERGSKKQKHGASLELGHLLSRVVPVYPEEAKRQGIQGTVKLHAVLDRYGSVKSLQPVSGPAILGAAVVNAVRQWQYTETKLAGQPVETEVDVAVVFRLSIPAAPKS
jgi:arsenate reductase